MSEAPASWLELGDGLEGVDDPAREVTVVRARKRGRFLEAEWDGLRLPGLRRWLGLAHAGYFLTKPHFGRRADTLPPRTLFFLGALDEGCAAVVPLLDGDFQCELAGGESGLKVRAEAGPRGAAADCVDAAVVARGDDPYETIERAMAAAVARMGRGRRRVEKALPPWVDELGWCTYDAFYNAVDERRILDALADFHEAGFFPRFLIVDGGWQRSAEGWEGLTGLDAKPGAFTDDRLATVAREARERFGVKHVGAWHTLFGGMRGVDPSAEAFAAFEPRAVSEPHTKDDVFGCVSPDRVDDFYDAYHGALAADGVDFVKVDFQSALALLTYDVLGRAEAARRWQQGLQAAAGRHLPAGVLNCMAMSSDMVYHTRESNVTRSSEDFFPERRNAHPPHVRQNLYNALWLGECVLPDWDMFWSGEAAAPYNARARAVSGGPVYVSDRPGRTDAALLNRFLAADGKLLRADRPARPTPDALFHDPAEAGTPIKAFTTTGEAAVLGLFHPQRPVEGVRIDAWAAPATIPGVAADRFAAWSCDRGYLGIVGRDAGIPVSLDPLEAELLTFAPLVDGVAAIGLTEKFLPAAAVRSVERGASEATIELRGGGPFAVVAERPIRGIALDGDPVDWRERGGAALVDTGGLADARITIAFADAGEA